MTEGFERAVYDLRKSYSPYPMQAEFHASPAPYRFLGGAAGPGKTTAMLVENLISVNEFNSDDAKQVQTLFLRRTQPMLENTVVTRFREKIDPSLYKKFTEKPFEVEWLNGATTRFGSMQYENDVYSWQGQWKDIYYDEMCEFTWKQWVGISAWNRCPVSRYARKMGAGNPIGVGAPWVRSIFVDHKPYDEMGDVQRKQYNAEDYAYFPCTYLDNPIFANDPQFIAGLMSLPEPLRKALMEGSWDVTGGYFTGAFDQATNVIPAEEFDPKPWHRQWLSGDWGFEHWTALYRHYMDDIGKIRTGRELMLQHHDPEMLAERIIEWLVDRDGKFPKISAFPFSHDAFANQTTKSYGATSNSVADRISKVLRPYGIALPVNSGKDKLGREQTMYNTLRNGTWLVCDDCPKLIGTLISAPRDDKRPEMIAEFTGDDPLQGAGYGIYWILGKPAAKPAEQLLRERLLSIEQNSPNKPSAEMAQHFARLEESSKVFKGVKRGYWG